MTHSQLPVGLRAQQTLAAFYRAGYPLEETADALGLTVPECREQLAAMRDAGWILRRPHGPHTHVQIDNAFLRARYLHERAQARLRGERLSLSGVQRAAGLIRPGQEPDPTWIARLLRLTPMPDGSLRTHIPLALALAIGRALGLDPHEIEAREVRPRPARFHVPRHGLPAVAAPDEDPADGRRHTRRAVAA